MASDTFDADALPALRLEEELRIGDVNDPRVGFSDIRAVQVGPDGTMYVLEAQDLQVRVYAEDGTLLRRIGGPGAGPGESSFPRTCSSWATRSWFPRWAGTRA